MNLANRVKRLEEITGATDKFEKTAIVIIRGMGRPEASITGLAAGNITINRLTDEEQDAFMGRATAEIIERWDEPSIPLAVVRYSNAAN